MSVTYTTFNGMIVHENRGGVERAYVPDTLGSTQALIDDTETVTDTWEYWPYGEVSQRTGTSSTPFSFLGVLGYFQDEISGLKYVRARYLKLDLSRWLTVDPLWPFLTAYRYAANMPQLKTDPSGLQECGGPCPSTCPLRPGVWGVTYCCDGQRVYCTAPHLPPQVRACIQEHEKVHADHKICKLKKGFEPTPSDPASECEGYTVQFRCCMNIKCKGDWRCDKFKEFCICSAASNAQGYCSEAGKPLDPAIDRYIGSYAELCSKMREPK